MDTFLETLICQAESCWSRCMRSLNIFCCYKTFYSQPPWSTVAMVCRASTTELSSNGPAVSLSHLKSVVMGSTASSQLQYSYVENSGTGNFTFPIRKLLTTLVLFSLKQTCSIGSVSFKPTPSTVSWFSARRGLDERYASSPSRAC